MEMKENIRRFLLKRGWLGAPAEVLFLEAGEYNENYRIRSEGCDYVFRLNHGSQLGLSNQIEYEYWVLKSLEDSGVTPRVFNYELDTDLPGNGVLLMEFIPGTPLQYRSDYEEAARIFAAVHAQSLSPKLIVQDRPVFDIAEESLGLINRFRDHPLQAQRKRLLEYHEEVLRLGEETKTLFREEKMCIVNTEVNSKNFILGERGGFLVDWEKAVVSNRYQDLGHFVVPTTTLWKSDFRFDAKTRMSFLRSYREHGALDCTLDEISFKTQILEKTILLRAMSWCYMAYYEYTMQERTLTNRETFDRIEMYMREMECFLK
jgi:aminoglycoside phosphotransferase (APT) family kinase protein